MKEVLPTFSRFYESLAAQWAGFSWRESAVTRGAVGALVGWMPVPLISGLFTALAGWASETDVPVSFVPDYGLVIFLTVVPWAPLAALCLGFWLAGRAPDLGTALKRGLQASSSMVLALMVLALAALGSDSEKDGLAAAIIFWIGVLLALLSCLGAALRRLYDRLMRPEAGFSSGAGR